jgi:hypothetical protein
MDGCFGIFGGRAALTSPWSVTGGSSQWKGAGTSPKSRKQHSTSLSVPGGGTRGTNLSDRCGVADDRNGFEYRRLC